MVFTRKSFRVFLGGLGIGTGVILITNPERLDIILGLINISIGTLALFSKNKGE